jgi:hypothetical protein
MGASQHPVDQEGVSVGANLGRDPGGQPYQSARQRLAQAKDPLEARKSDLYLLSDPVPPLGATGCQKDVHLGQGLSQLLAAVGQISQEPPRYPFSQSRLVDEFFGQGDVRDIGCGELVGDRNSVGRAKQMQLHSLDGEGTPPYPRGPIETRALRDLPGVQDRKQRRVDEQRLWIADHLGEDVAAQRLQEAPKLPYPPMERGRV